MNNKHLSLPIAGALYDVTLHAIYKQVTFQQRLL